MTRLNDLIKNAKPKMEEALEFAKEEIKKIRAGQASGGIVEDLKVDYYGSKVALKEMASISTPDPQTIFVQPYDQSAKEQITLAIRNSDLNLNPSDDGQRIILNLPPLSSERREEFIKLVGEKSKQAKLSIRQAREVIWNQIQEMEKDGKLTEDDKYSGKDKLDELVGEYNQKIDELADEKIEKLKNI
jgi:ribosome recycling factor